MPTRHIQNDFAITLCLLLTQSTLTIGANNPSEATIISTTDEFSFSCLPLTTQLSDPIMSPGKESSHTHIVTGGTAFQRTMGMQTAPNASATTCEVLIDKSNYWVPALYHMTSDRSFEMMEYESSAIYYLHRACDYVASAKACKGGSYPLAPPAGLRIVAGDPRTQTYNDASFAQRAISHMCLMEDGSSNETKHLPRQSCEKLRSQVFFPSCWDGRNLDSTDHKSHMAYPEVGDYNKGVCPKSHPVAIFSIFMEFIFNTKPFPDHHNWVYATGDRNGYGMHGDFINGWMDQESLQRAFKTCTGKGWLSDPRCSITQTQKAPLSPASLEPDEPIPWQNLGQNGTIQRLPGHPEHAV
ncbi:DUF1996 domain-containing protein [Aspergillus puulaauensis]|uniref:DUF1996 domain-containing protein n=1 Tax=Aspergillus puulaauensis TaxID=1220207 RepID=A0A7R7XI70_9EURO|nr:uncharacterized protein APUU_21855S [Aspergillus puulaauensis]BCS21423.1 hypothetical protein APUU_21855S [Aspergillus puulaauensis]